MRAPVRAGFISQCARLLAACAVLGMAGGCMEGPPLARILRPSWGPPGSGIAFLAGTERNHGTEMWLAGTDGTAPPRRLLHARNLYEIPVWRPDGTAIAVTSLSSAGSALWLVSVTSSGARARQIATGDSVSWPDWSQDSRWLAWQTADTKGATQSGGMCVAEVAGEDLGPVSSLAAWEPLCPQWSPDGERLTYLEAEIGGVRDARGLFVVGRDGTGRKQVGSLQCVHRVWSGPHELTFETVNNHRAKALVEVWRADVDTGRTRRVFGAELPRLAGSSDERPRWTRDRTRLLVVAGLSKSRPGAPGSERGMGGSIYVLDVGRKTVRQLTAGLWDEDPAWSSDGSEVVFVRGGTSLWVMKADGSGQRKVAGINALGQVAGVEGEGPPPAP